MPRKYLSAIIGLVILASLGALVWWYSSRSVAVPNETEHQASGAPPTAALPSGPTILYTEQIKLEEIQQRSWPTVRIMRKVGDAAPEQLAEVGKVGEFANVYNFKLSPDRSKLLINLESKLQVLDLATKKLEDVMTARKEFDSAVWSSDGKKIFGWDQYYLNNELTYSYYLRIFDLASKRDELVEEAVWNGRGFLFAQAWRFDNAIVLLEGYGDFGIIRYYDLTNKKLLDTPGNPTFHMVSDDGRLATTFAAHVPDICNDFSGENPSVYTALDPVSGQIFGTVGEAGKITTIKAFSPDNKRILYATEAPKTEKVNCNIPNPRSYFIVDIDGKNKRPVPDLYAALAEWKLLDWDYKNYPDGLNFDIVVNGQVLADLVQSKNELQVIKAYIQEAQPTASARVELDIFSGRPNPRWELSLADTATLAAMLDKLPPAHPVALFDGLGYRGFRVTASSPLAGATAMRIYKDVIALDSTNFRSDPTRSIERWLLTTAKVAMSAEDYTGVVGIMEAK